MNAVTNALVDLRYKIPPEILNIGFRENAVVVNQVIGLDERVLNSVIRTRVLKDCNLVGGVEMVIPIEQCNIRQVTMSEYIIEIPKPFTNNKSIISVLALMGGSYNVSGTVNLITSPVEQGLNNMYNNLSTLSIIQTTRLELIGENVILVQDPSMLLSNGFVRCVIENNTNLENISPRNYIAFSELVARAVKSYIFNNTRVKLQQGYIYGGHELPVVTDIVNEYSDFENMYLEYLTTTWKKVAFINNGDSVSRLIKSMIGNQM